MRQHITDTPYACPVCQIEANTFIYYPARILIKKTLRKFIKFPNDYSCINCAKACQEALNEEAKTKQQYLEVGFTCLDMGDVV